MAFKLNNKKVFIAAGLIVIILFGVFLYDRIEILLFNPQKAPVIGDIIADVGGQDIHGQKKTLAQYQGKYILLNFWAVWCEPCKNEMPFLEEVFANNQDKIVVIGVDQGDPPAVLKQFLTEKNITFPIWLDEESAIADKFLVKAFPTTLILGPDRKLLAIHIGELNRILLQNYLDEVSLK